MQRTTLVTAAVAAVVSGLVVWFAVSQSGKVTILSPKHDFGACTPAKCDVKIKFICGTTSPSPSTCEPYADLELISVQLGHIIKFGIENPAGATYIFDPTDGINVTKSLSGNPFNGYFDCHPQPPSSTAPDKYWCEVKIPHGTAPDVYKYAIHIKTFAIVDPWIVNY